MYIFSEESQLYLATKFTFWLINQFRHVASGKNVKYGNLPLKFYSQQLNYEYFICLETGDNKELGLRLRKIL